MRFVVMRAASGSSSVSRHLPHRSDVLDGIEAEQVASPRVPTSAFVTGTVSVCGISTTLIFRCRANFMSESMSQTNPP